MVITKTEPFAFWENNPAWNFSLIRIIGLADFGGSNFAEIMEAAQRITPYDVESWHTEWYKVANRVEDLGEYSEKLGNYITARNAYQRASNYYRTAQFYLSGDDERKISTLKKVRELFLKAAKYIPEVEKVEIFYEQEWLHGYWIKGKGEGNRPTMIYINGSDSLSEEAYFTAGSFMAESGYNFLVFNAPGVGLSLYEKNLSTRFDSENFITPAVDWVLNEKKVDPDNLILIGESYAGYLIPRALAFENRFKAAVIWSAIYEYQIGYRFETEGETTRKHLMRLFGKNESNIMDVEKEFTLRGILPKVRTPMLIIHGAEDTVRKSGTSICIRVYEELGSDIKKLRVIEQDEGLGGATHCQKDNLHLAHSITLDWLSELS